MKYEETFMEVRYLKPKLENNNKIPQEHVEAIRKIITYKLSL